jgi:hypothetical protein
MRIAQAGILLTLVALGLSTGIGAPDAEAQKSRPSGRAGENRDRPATDLGRWHGTWTHVHRDGRTAMWIDESGEKIRVRIQYQGTSKPEGFVTDWDGAATYIFAGEPGTFEMKITEADENRIHGTWFWDVQFESVGRSERGTFMLYRVGDGRQLTFDFSEFESVLRKGDKVSRYDGAAAWSYRKVSKRIALWDEVF